MALRPGDPAPWFTANCSVNPVYHFDTAAGRYLVLCIVARGDAEPGKGLVSRVAGLPVFDDRNASLFVVTAEPADAQPGRLPLRTPGVRAFYDPDRAIAALYGVDGDGPLTVLISPRLQILALVTDTDPETHVGRLLDLFRRLPVIASLPPWSTHPPVLILPHVLEPDLCRVLIDGYHRYGGVVSGFMREQNGRTVGVHDRNHKSRRDWTIEEEALIGALQNRVIRRLVPEIRKSFQFEVTRMERYLVACYDAGEGGHFRAHRDNTTKGTAHRRFAVTINLNAEAYEGGDLRFPEFGPGTYRPPTGGAVVFSCSLLHEVEPMRRGTRYAFLPFLYDETARRIREENLPFLAVDEPKIVV